MVDVKLNLVFLLFLSKHSVLHLPLSCMRPPPLSLSLHLLPICLPAIYLPPPLSLPFLLFDFYYSVTCTKLTQRVLNMPVRFQ